MRRVVLTILALVIVPSIAMATAYRCAYDGVTRAACCCPTKAHATETPTGGPTLRAACCCEITQAAAPARTIGTSAPVLDLPVAPSAVIVGPILAPVYVRVTARERPRAQRGPPSSLLARRCSLLL